MACVDVIVLADDSADEAVDAVAAAAPAAPRGPLRPAQSSKKRRLARAPAPLEAAAGPSEAAAGASACDVIDLTADEDAFASAWRDFELVDLTGDDDEPAVPPRAAKPAAKSAAVVDDVLAHQRAKIRSFLRQRGAALRVEACDANPHAAPGTPLYARFAAALRRVSNKSIQLAFHGTAEANIDAICREGLDPKRRAGQALGPGGALRCAARRPL
jgi:hypothetical protein